MFRGLRICRTKPSCSTPGPLGAPVAARRPPTWMAGSAAVRPAGTGSAARGCGASKATSRPPANAAARPSTIFDPGVGDPGRRHHSGFHRAPPRSITSFAGSAPCARASGFLPTDRVLLYATGGLAVGELDANFSTTLTGIGTLLGRQPSHAGRLDRRRRRRRSDRRQLDRQDRVPVHGSRQLRRRRPVRHDRAARYSERRPDHGVGLLGQPPTATVHRPHPSRRRELPLAAGIHVSTGPIRQMQNPGLAAGVFCWRIVGAERCGYALTSWRWNAT